MWWHCICGVKGWALDWALNCEETSYCTYGSDCWFFVTFTIDTCGIHRRRETKKAGGSIGYFCILPGVIDGSIETVKKENLSTSWCLSRCNYVQVYMSYCKHRMFHPSSVPLLAQLSQLFHLSPLPLPQCNTCKYTVHCHSDETKNAFTVTGKSRNRWKEWSKLVHLVFLPLTDKTSTGTGVLESLVDKRWMSLSLSMSEV